MTRISVITNCFNDARYLRGNVESVLTQRETDFEHIVVDCGSTDGSVGVLRALAHPRLRVLEVPRCGLAAARNQAIATARGELVAILDADDRALGDRLTAPIAAFAQNPRLVACGGTFRRVDEATGRTREYAFPRDDRGLRILLDCAINPIGSPTATFRRDAFLRAGGYDERFRHAEDYELMLRLRGEGAVATVGRPLANYAFRAGSHSDRSFSEARDVVHYTILGRLLEASRRRDDRALQTLDDALLGIGRRGIYALRGRWSVRALLRRGVFHPRASRYLAVIARVHAAAIAGSRGAAWWRHTATPENAAAYWLGGAA